ncbi:MAG TPA: GumC family protein [Terriglobales bacterium]|nr:GumC family protein [Terriglobales bacterium]
MNDRDFAIASERFSSRFSVRDLLAIGFRHKRTALICFFGILMGAVLVAVLQPAQYRATTKFLVDRERQDPVVSPEQSAPVVMRNEVTEEELNSEIELLQSEDVLRQVVVSCGLDHGKSLREYVLGPASPEKKIAMGTARLRDALQIDPIKKSNLISVSYTSTDPQLASRVLRELGDAYIQKHVAVHTPPGQVQFFDVETERYKKELGDAEAQLKAFSGEENGVAPQMTRDITLQKLSEFRSSLQQTRAAMAASEQRIRTLEKQSGTTPERLTTAMRSQDDYQVLQGLKNTLMTLELKRTELLTKYQPTYPLVQEVDKQIADTKASIATEEAQPVKEETTDRNPTYAWINEELAKAKAEYSGLQAQAAAQQAIVEKYETTARDLEQKGLVEQDLLRDVKTDEENYLLYQRKREQARMTEALDRTRIVNVAIAEQPVVPSLPSNSPALVVLLGMLLAATVTMGTVFVQEYLDPSFRTPAEVSAELNVPVLAAVPQSFEGFSGNGADGTFYPSVPLTSTVPERGGN